MRRKILGFILVYIRSDHGGQHVHVYRDNHPLGVYDRSRGPIRGLEGEWGPVLRDAIAQFEEELHARGY